MGMENGSPIEGNIDNVRYFYDRGIRYITLAHSLSNHISDSSYDENRQWHDLSEFGVEVVEEMNRLGIMVDISHVSDEAFWQVMDISKVPAIASHSSARHFTPDFERNMSDAMIQRLAENGGGDSLPVGLKDVSTYPALVEGLLRRGYSATDIRKILGENLLRVWEAVEGHAAQIAQNDQAAKKNR